MADATSAPRAPRPAARDTGARVTERADAGPTTARCGRRSAMAASAGSAGGAASGPGNRAMGRLLGGAGRPDGAQGPRVRQLAMAGTRGTPRRLPHVERIQAAFGKHDVSHIRAHLGGAANRATRSIGVQAYATGRDVVFGQTPSLFMAAHEAAHVMQQRAGVQFWGGDGAGGARRRAETEADDIARRVVEGRSAEQLIDRMGRGSAGRRGPAPIQFWGEPDHYILNQAAGQLAIDHLAKFEHIERKDYLRGRFDEVPGKGRTKMPDGGDIVRSDRPLDTFKLRTDGGGYLTYGGAGRYAGDLAPTPTGGPTRGKSLEGWASHTRKKDDDYGHLKMTDFTEYGLMATNANHFYPLAGVEYRRHHQMAKQKVWMASVLREKSTSKEDHAAALSLAREALMYEGFASHFLADSFAAGHLAPHALARIAATWTPKSTAGARVNTWHDVLNGLPDGVPTTLGRFHGDYTMDGHDLKYISNVIAQSLLEVAMPWYTGKSHDGGVVLPKPDVPKIMADPVAGPIWAQMCKDYLPQYTSLMKVKRRKGKHSLSKYAIYKTTAESQIAHDEVMPELTSSLFSDGEVPVEIDDTDGNPEKVAIKVLQIASALRHLLGFKGGWQIHAGVTQGFEKTSYEKQKGYKYRLDLQSDNALKRFTDATPPLVPLMSSLEAWLEAWKSVCEPLTEHEAGRKIRARLGIIAATLHSNFKSITGIRKKDTRRAKLRTETLRDLDGVLDLFGEMGITAPDVDRTTYTQGPTRSVTDTSTWLPSSSTLPVRPASGRVLELMGAALDRRERPPPEERAAIGEAMFRMCRSMSMICADPRPARDTHHALLYRSAADVAIDLMRFFEERASIEGPLQKVHEKAEGYFSALVVKLNEMKEMGDLSMTDSTTKESTRENSRREIIKALVAACGPYYELKSDALYEATGRRIDVD